MHKISYAPARRQNSHFSLSHFMVQQGVIHHSDEFPVIAFSVKLVPLAGGLAPVVLLDQMVFWTAINKEKDPQWDGWIYKEQQEWRQETGLTRSELELARGKLRQRGLLEERYQKFPRRLYYRVNLDNLRATWHQQARPPARTSRSKPPRRLLTPVVTPAPPADDAQAEPQQTTMLLAYNTAPVSVMGKNPNEIDIVQETRRQATPPVTGKNPNEIDIVQVSRIMEEPAPSAAGAQISPPFDTPASEEKPHEIDIVQVSCIHSAGNLHYGIAINPNEIGTLRGTARAETTTEKEKAKSARAREGDLPVVSVVLDAGATKALAFAQDSPAATPPTGSTTPPLGTPAPAQVSLVEEVRGWAQKHTPGLDLAHQHARWLAYCQAMELTFENLPKAFRRWLWEAHARATRNGHTPAAPPTPTPPTPSAEDARWREAYDRAYGEPPPRAPDEIPPAEDVPAEASLDLVQSLATSLRMPSEGDTAQAVDTSGRLGTTSEPQGLRIVREALESSQGTRSGEVSWHANQVLQQARDARYHGQLSAAQFHAIKDQLRAAMSLAEVNTISAEIAGAAEPVEPRTIEDGAPP
jgi:hypothetical protein